VTTNPKPTYISNEILILINTKFELKYNANMKKLLLLLLLSLGLIGCSSIDNAELTSPMSPFDTQVNRILALDLSHAESLKEANKLTDPDLAVAVVNELEAKKLQADNAIIEAEIVAKYAEKIKISDSNSKFIGPEISETKKRGLLADPDYLNYFLSGIRGNDGLIQHQLHFSIKHDSEDRRDYYSASQCDRWKGCTDDGNEMDITLISSNASGCNGNVCSWMEVMELKLSDEFLRSNMDTGFSMRFNANKKTSKITISSLYIKGYLKVTK
jgi:hypothetical protein